MTIEDHENDGALGPGITVDYRTHSPESEDWNGNVFPRSLKHHFVMKTGSVLEES